LDPKEGTNTTWERGIGGWYECAKVMKIEGRKRHGCLKLPFVWSKQLRYGFDGLVGNGDFCSIISYVRKQALLDLLHRLHSKVKLQLSPVICMYNLVDLKA
jgi:hypothetical protein